MGAQWRPQLSDYWCTKRDGYRVPFVVATMREDRYARMALGKCPRRFQRQLFLASDFPIVGLVNVRVAFGCLSAKLSDALKQEAGTFGYNRLFQLRLGEAVVQHGID